MMISCLIRHKFPFSFFLQETTNKKSPHLSAGAKINNLIDQHWVRSLIARWSMITHDLILKPSPIAVRTPNSLTFNTGNNSAIVQHHQPVPFQMVFTMAIRNCIPIIVPMIAITPIGMIIHSSQPGMNIVGAPLSFTVLIHLLKVCSHADKNICDFRFGPYVGVDSADRL